MYIVFLDSSHRFLEIKLVFLNFFSGYVKEQIEDSMVMCEASFQGDSSLECSKYLRYTLYIIMKYFQNISECIIYIWGALEQRLVNLINFNSMFVFFEDGIK